MLTIGEFSNICKVSAKTLRYYEDIGLLLPDEVNPENGYRYYSIGQLEAMLFINRLKSYDFSLEEIKTILNSEERKEEALCLALVEKEQQLAEKVREYQKTLEQLKGDIVNLKEGRNMMAYLEDIGVQLVKMPEMRVLAERKMVMEAGFADAYGSCYQKLFRRIQEEKLTTTAPPMVLFHSEEFSAFGMDTEFAIPIRESVRGSRDFCPGLCLKTTLCGSYSGLPSVYAKQREWAEREGYESSGPLFEVYVADPSQIEEESGLVTEIYYPVKKKTADI